MFDVFQFAEKLSVLEVAREHSFSPLKNAAGAPNSTAETCRQDLYKLHRTYLTHAGAEFTNSRGDKLPLEKMGEAEAVEIHPLASYAGEVCGVVSAELGRGVGGKGPRGCFPATDLLSIFFPVQNLEGVVKAKSPFKSYPVEITPADV